MKFTEQNIKLFPRDAKRNELSKAKSYKRVVRE